MWRMINVEEDEDDSTYEVMDLPKTFVHVYDRDPDVRSCLRQRSHPSFIEEYAGGLLMALQFETGWRH